ncbi:hypothetical protein DW877_21905, partial [[Clostridium] symbiosum]
FFMSTRIHIIRRARLHIFILLGGKAQICYAGGPCFLNNFFRKTYAARQVDFAQTNGFKVFLDISQGNPLIQSQY